MNTEKESTCTGCTDCKCNKKKEVIESGVTCDQLLFVDNNNDFKCIRLFEEKDGADVGFEITSTDESGKHTYLNQYLDKKIKVTIEVVD